MVGGNRVQLPWQCLVLLINLIVCNSQTYCRGTQNLTATSGEIMSHSGAGVSSYQNGMLCYWQITAPEGSVIAALITYADFETCCDYVSLYDGSIGSTSLISKVSVSASSGYISPRFTSSSNTMTINFYSDSSRTMLGFKLSYVIFNSLTSSSSCGAISYTDSSNMTGVITSHVNFGSASYSPNMTCIRTLPKRSGYAVSLTVTSLSLGSGDCLRLPTSSLSMSSLSSNPTGSSIYCSPYASSTALTIDSEDGAQIVFSSNGQAESSGFSISFAYAALIEGNFSLSSNSGEIASHSGVGITPCFNNMRYSWQITVPVGSIVWAKFAYMSLQNPNDVVAVYDSNNGMPSLLAAVTNSSSATLPQIFTSSSNVMAIRFRTGGSGSGLGFRLQFNATTSFIYCSGFRDVSATDGGEIVSHSGVRLSNYPNNIACNWLISAPTGYKVTAWFTYLDLEACCDTVTLYEGIAFVSGTVRIDNTFRTIATINGLSAPMQVYTSTSNSMTVRFTTDGTTTQRGFVLRYSAQPASGVSEVGAISGGTVTALVVLGIVFIVCKCCCCNGGSSVPATSVTATSVTTIIQLNDVRIEAS